MALHTRQVYDDGVDYLALAEALMAKPRYQRKLINKWVGIMVNDNKRNVTGVVMLLLAALFLVGAAYAFHVPPLAFAAIVFGSLLMGLVAWLLWNRIL